MPGVVRAPKTAAPRLSLLAAGFSVLLPTLAPARVAASDPPWQSAPGYRWRSIATPPPSPPGFITIQALGGRGIPFTNRVSSNVALNNQILENGAGVALGDVDLDGLVDVYLCGSEVPNALFRNLGDWRFQDITADAGVACPNQFSTGAVLADLDGDRDLDLLVNGLGTGTRLFGNDGRGRFTEVARSGLNRRFGATSLALADADGDGDLDLYVATYRVMSARSEVPPPRVEVRRVQGRLLASPADRFLAFPLADGTAELAEKGEPDSFYLNDGSGRFTEVPWSSGLFRDESGNPVGSAPEDWSLSVLFRDLTGDGLPDLYVCNDFFRSRDQFWIHDGSGHFRAVPSAAWRHMSLSSMAADAADIDRDGHDDFLVAEMLSGSHESRHRQRANAFRPEQALPFSEPTYQPELPRNTLFRARGDGTFAEIALLAGIAASEWSWNVAFLDVDLDGFEDVLFANGNAHDVLDLDAQNALDLAATRGPVRNLEFYPPLPQRTLGFRNRGNLSFVDSSTAWGLTDAGVSQGMAFGDLDGDGDLDVILNRLNQPALCLRNQSSAPRIHVRLVGLPPNTRGIGARIRVSGNGFSQSQEIIAGGRYLSSDDPSRTFAAPDSSTTYDVEVRWRNGRTSNVRGIEPNRFVQIAESSASTTTNAAARSPNIPNSLPVVPPLFTNVSAAISHRHADPGVPDFSRQRLLPRALDHPGPGVAWLDHDGDGREDLCISDGPGKGLRLYRNSGHGAFHSSPFPGLAPSESREFLGLVSSGPGPVGPGWIAVASGKATELFSTTGQRSIPSGTPKHPRESRTIHHGPTVLADFDGDGDLDVFIAGMHELGRYPEAARSAVVYFENGQPTAPEPTPGLAAPGLVRGAVAIDLDRNGRPSLVLACEWGPIRVFHRTAERWNERTSELGLDVETGLWAGIASGDFDEDGLPDLVAANLGRNTRHRLGGDSPWRLYAFDADQDGALEIIEAYRPAESLEFRPWRTLDILGPAIPAWRQRFRSFREFGATGIDTLLAGVADHPIVVEARTFEHSVFLRRGSRFQRLPLPVEAQFSPAFGVSVADFDGDGHDDVFLAQNDFDLDLDSGRSDAGTGVCLLGDGQGGFHALSPAASGIHLSGQQRGSAVADFDEDGRPDLAVGQNNGTTGLFRNSGGRPQTRVRLRGSAANPLGVGATVRQLADGRPFGPVREVRSGTGYLSNDSPALFFTRSSRAASLEIVWPGGRKSTYPFPETAVEIVP